MVKNNKIVQFINDFYTSPKEISKNEYDKISLILYDYKKEIIEDKYILYVGNSDIVNKLFILFIHYYNYSISLDNKHKHKVGIDMEFNRGVIALMQLNFGKINILNKMMYIIWIIDPKKFSRDKLNIISKMLFENSKIYKVFHGADSLDLPYIFTDILEGNQKRVINFMKKFIDTRFLCEYVRFSKNDDGKCSIYDAMLYFNTIDKNKYDDLNKINELMGPIQDVMWDINKLSSFHIKYAYYDVLYLLTFLDDIYKTIINTTPQYVRTYYYIVQIVRFVILERKMVTNILDISKNVVNPINNYLIKSDKGNITILEIYNNIMKDFVIEDDKGIIDFNFIESVNYIKGTFNFLLKHITFYEIQNKYTIYKNKNEEMRTKITIDDVYLEIEKIGLYKITRLLKLYQSNIKNKLNI